MAKRRRCMPDYRTGVQPETPHPALGNHLTPVGFELKHLSELDGFLVQISIGTSSSELLRITLHFVMLSLVAWLAQQGQIFPHSESSLGITFYMMTLKLPQTCCSGENLIAAWAYIPTSAFVKVSAKI